MKRFMKDKSNWIYGVNTPLLAAGFFIILFFHPTANVTGCAEGERMSVKIRSLWNSSKESGVNTN